MGELNMLKPNFIPKPRINELKKTHVKHKKKFKLERGKNDLFAEGFGP